MPRRIIIDTDPGIDDAVAILLALASPGAGGARPRRGRRQSAAGGRPSATRAPVCELAGRPDIPVYAGCARPIERARSITAEHVHGESGLGGLVLPEPTMRAAARSTASIF